VYLISIQASQSRCAATERVNGRRIYTRNIARLVRQHRLDGDPFKFAEFAAHDSRSRFGSLNHAQCGNINPQRPIRVSDTGPSIPEIERQAVGKRFYRSDKSRGTGGPWPRLELSRRDCQTARLPLYDRSRAGLRDGDCLPARELN